jgi:hypothetical protein
MHVRGARLLGQGRSSIQKDKKKEQKKGEKKVLKGYSLTYISLVQQVVLETEQLYQCINNRKNLLT